MKRLAYITLNALLLAVAAFTSSGCSDKVDILQAYPYSVETLPLPKSLLQRESINLEFSINRKGYYANTTYQFRYFQSQGKGDLTNGKGQTIPVNRFQPIESDSFILTYTNLTEEQVQLDFVFEDSFGQRVEYTVKFEVKRQNEKQAKKYVPTRSSIKQQVIHTETSTIGSEHNSYAELRGEGVCFL